MFLGDPNVKLTYTEKRRALFYFVPTNLWTAGEDLKGVQIVERRPLDDWSAT